MTIKILLNSITNKIVAGKVIEIPASVVKELVKNSIDAGSTKINIILECAGKGMSKDGIKLAIQRHLTAKLDEDDLLNTIVLDSEEKLFYQ